MTRRVGEDISSVDEMARPAYSSGKLDDEDMGYFSSSRPKDETIIRRTEDNLVFLDYHSLSSVIMSTCPAKSVGETLSLQPADIDSGVDLIYIQYLQEIPGHNSPKTTMLYTHLSGKDINDIRSDTNSKYI